MTNPLIRNYISCSENALKLTYSNVEFKVVQGRTPGPPASRGGWKGRGGREGEGGGEGGSKKPPRNFPPPQCWTQIAAVGTISWLSGTFGAFGDFSGKFVSAFNSQYLRQCPSKDALALKKFLSPPPFWNPPYATGCPLAESRLHVYNILQHYLLVVKRGFSDDWSDVASPQAHPGLSWSHRHIQTLGRKDRNHPSLLSTPKWRHPQSL